MSVTENITACLRAQEHGHQPVIACTNRGQVSGNVSETLRAESPGALPMIATRSAAYGICSFASNSMLSDNPHSGIYEADTSRTLDMNCGNPACNQGGIVIVSSPKVYDARGNGDGETVPTLTGDHENRVTDYTAICIGNGQVDQLRVSDKVGALNCMHDQQAIISIDRAAFNQGENACYDINISDDGIAPSQVAKGPSAICAAVACRNGTENSDVNGTLQAKSTGGQSLNLNNVVRYRYTVRRLTPLECERLQGFPDGWTDIEEWTDSKGKVHKECADTARYKALGNSIALPPWLYVLQKLSLSCGGDCTMASLFDGIGGFPLLWEYLNGRGTCLWASEIEEFPIAVTKYHFPEVQI